MRGLRAAAPALLLTALAAGQQTLVPANPAHGDIRAAKDGLVLPAGEFTVTELIEATAGYLCRNYLYDYGPIEAAAGFRLQQKLAVDALGAEELLYALLSTRGFAVLPVDELRGVYGIVPIGDGQSRSPTPWFSVPWRPADEIVRRPHLREIVMTHVAVESIDARHLANMLRHTATPGGWQPGALLATAADEQNLMLHGWRDQVASAIRLATQLDRVAQPRHEELLQRIEALERRIAELERRGR